MFYARYSTLLRCDFPYYISRNGLPDQKSDRRSKKRSKTAPHSACSQSGDRDLSNKKKIFDLSHTVTEIHASEVYTYYIDLFICFLQYFNYYDLGVTLTLKVKVKVTSPHRDLSNKKKIIDLSHTVTEIHAFEVYTYYIDIVMA